MKLKKLSNNGHRNETVPTQALHVQLPFTLLAYYEVALPSCSSMKINTSGNLNHFIGGILKNLKLANSASAACYRIPPVENYSAVIRWQLLRDDDDGFYC